MGTKKKTDTTTIALANMMAKLDYVIKGYHNSYGKPAAVAGLKVVISEKTWVALLKSDYVPQGLVEPDVQRVMGMPVCRVIDDDVPFAKAHIAVPLTHQWFANTLATSFHDLYIEGKKITEATVQSTVAPQGIFQQQPEASCGISSSPMYTGVYTFSGAVPFPPITSTITKLTPEDLYSAVQNTGTIASKSYKKDEGEVAKKVKEELAKAKKANESGVTAGEHVVMTAKQEVAAALSSVTDKSYPLTNPPDEILVKKYATPCKASGCINTLIYLEDQEPPSYCPYCEKSQTVLKTKTLPCKSCGMMTTTHYYSKPVEYCSQECLDQAKKAKIFYGPDDSWKAVKDPF